MAESVSSAGAAGSGQRAGVFGFRSSARFDAVICDLDGCLAPENDGDIDLGPIERIAAHNRAAWAERDRPLLTLCTGRPISFVECLARALACRLPVIAENGVWLWDPVSRWHERDPAITREHTDAIARATAWVEDELSGLGVTMQPGKVASVSLHHEDSDLLHSLTPRVERAFGALGLPIRVSATWHYINCDLTIVSKTTGIERLCARAGLDRSRLAGIGDTPADLKIRDGVSFFACPSNAKAELKPECDFVAGRPMGEGVLEILERLAGEGTARAAGE